jgi:hypothetical protein
MGVSRISVSFVLHQPSDLAVGTWANGKARIGQGGGPAGSGKALAPEPMEAREMSPVMSPTGPGIRKVPPAILEIVGDTTNINPRDPYGISGATKSGRLDLSQRPLAPQSRPHHESSDAGSRKSSQFGEVSEEELSVPSPGLVDFRRSLNAPVMQENVTVGAYLLLTVKEVSTATVYSLCEGGKLAYTRVSTHSMRILQGDLAAYVRSTRVRSGPA